MKCPECGRHIATRAKFCPYCGKASAPRRSRNKTIQTRKPNWPLYLTLVLAGIALGVCAFRFLQKPESLAKASPQFDPTLRGDQLDQLYPVVYAVAAEFMCPCGSCADGVEACDCEMARGASEVRHFIYELLQVHEAPHATELVAQKYGYRKNGAAPAPKFERSHSPAWQAPPINSKQ